MVLIKKGDSMNVGVILFGGIGRRLLKDIPKQFIRINGKTLMEHTLDRFVNNINFDFLVVVVNEKYKKESLKIIENYKKEIYVVSGGKEREYSTLNAIKFLENKLTYDDVVLIHDGARPFIYDKIINENLIKASQYGAVVTAIQSENTVALIENEKIKFVPKRKNVFIVQTPQTFKFGILKESFYAFENELSDFTDDASVVLKNGYEVHIVYGDKKNVKITTIEDLKFLGDDSFE